MAHINGVFRLGRDAELRRTPSGEAVVNLALAFNYGKKGEDGNRPSQWIEVAMWGARAEALAPYLKKGGQIAALIADPHIETFQRNNGGGEGFKLVGRVMDVELVGPRQDAVPGAARAPAAAPAGRPPAAAPQARQSSGFDDMDSDIPF